VTTYYGDIPLAKGAGGKYKIIFKEDVGNSNLSNPVYPGLGITITVPELHKVYFAIPQVMSGPYLCQYASASSNAFKVLLSRVVYQSGLIIDASGDNVSGVIKIGATILGE
jgi:hypothetical protein